MVVVDFALEELGVLASAIRDLLMDSTEGRIAGSSTLRLSWVEDWTGEADGSFFSVVVFDFAVEETGLLVFEIEGLLVDSLEGIVDKASALRFGGLDCGIAGAAGSFLSVVVVGFAVEELVLLAFAVEDLSVED